MTDFWRTIILIYIFLKHIFLIYISSILYGPYTFFVSKIVFPNELIFRKFQKNNLAHFRCENVQHYDILLILEIFTYGHCNIFSHFAKKFHIIQKMKIFNFLPIWATLAKTGPSGPNLEFPGSPRVNETCGSLENAEICENYCQDLYQECSETCPDSDDQEIGKIHYFKNYSKF